MTAMTATRTAHAPAPTGHTPAPDAGTQRLTLAKAINLGLGAALGPTRRCCSWARTSAGSAASSG